MAEAKTVAVIPLKGSNYPTWKIQCKMALIREGLWDIVIKEETEPTEEAELTRYMSKRNRALAIIVLSVDPSLLYLLGEPSEPDKVWTTLENQFQKKTWANKLALRRKLHSTKMKEGESVQEHVKTMTELFNELSVIGDAIDEEDKVIYLLASLPESYNTLVTALEANETVPKMETITERILHAERKQADGKDEEKVYVSKHHSRGKGPRCHYCKRLGHIQKNCFDCLREEKDKDKGRTPRPSKSGGGKQTKPAVGLVTCHALGTSDVQGDYWIIDSGATCHICNDRSLFEEFESLQKPQEVTLGDRSILKAQGTGVVTLKLKLPGGKTLTGRLSNVLYVPKLAYNLLSVSKITEMGKRIHFNDTEGRVIDGDGELVAIALRTGNLYYLNCERLDGNMTNAVNSLTLENIWHRRFGHLGENNLRKLAKDGLVHGFDYDVSKKIDFCESCVSGRIHRLPFSGTRTRAKEPLSLIHSDVCGKISSVSLGGAEYFLTFIDDKSHYVWIYLLKNKHEVFQKFLEWKAMVERSTGHKVKTLRSDNGGEYTSNKFEDYLKKEGIKHEYTIPKTPEQNGVSERMNRTLVEKVRSMLTDSKLPHRFWAEALATAVYLLNRSPTKTLGNKTPFEEWTGEKPGVNHLRIFGCRAYTHIPKDERKKLDSKAKKCIFLGYGGLRKGYRLYDQRSSCVIYSRDVVFNESVRGIETEQEESRIVRVESYDDSEDDLVTQAAREPDADTEEPEAVDIHAHTNSQICTDANTNTHTFVDTGNHDQEGAVLRRSTRETRRPDHFGVWIYSTNATEKEPTTVTEALEGIEREEWQTAMEKEMESISNSDVWDLVELPSGKRLIGNKWVFKRKLKPDGSVERYKARLVAQGFTQKQGQDYDETFSPVIRFESLRTLIALAVQKGMRLHQMDVTAAFLNGNLKEEVYMRQPEGFLEKGKEHLVCRLKHSLYGLKQSSRCWNFALDNQLKEMGFTQSFSDPCIYTSTEGGMSIIGVYVDDIVLAGESTEKIQEIKSTLSMKFNMKDLGELNHFLGVQVIQDHDKGTVWIGQPQYTETVLEKFGMDQSKSIRTPVNTNLKLKKSTEESELADEALYQSAVGSLLYLSTRTRPDISYAVGNVARFCSRPTKDHWMAVKRIFRYLRGTTHLGLLYNKCKDESLIGYSDADWGGDVDNYRSTTGYIFQIGGVAVSWKSKKQDCVALSTAEAEYMALACTAQEAVWMRELNTDMNNKLNGPTTIFEDNQSAICMAKNPQFHGRVKHIGIKYHFIREQVNAGSVEIKYCRTEDMVADIFTKGLTQEKFEKLRTLCGIHSQPASEKECGSMTLADRQCLLNHAE